MWPHTSGSAAQTPRPPDPGGALIAPLSTAEAFSSDSPLSPSRTHPPHPERRPGSGSLSHTEASMAHLRPRVLLKLITKLLQLHKFIYLRSSCVPGARG